MSAFANAIERFGRMPRALQWALAGGLAIGLYLLWDSAIRPWSQEWNEQAQTIQDHVRDVRSTERVVNQLGVPETARLVTAIGPVRVPLPVAEGSKQFNEVVLEVLQKHGATSPNFSSRSRGKLGKTSLMEVTKGIERIDRLTGDVKFDATPKAAAAIIAELESSPHVESVNSVRLTRDAGGRVKVSLTIEAWMRASEARAAQGESI